MHPNISTSHRLTKVLLMFACVGVLSYSTAAGAFFRCQLYKWRTQDLHYKTTYAFAAGQTEAALKRYPSLPKKGVLAIARLFEVGSDVAQIKPCTNLSITKRLFLQRRDDADAATATVGL